MTPPTGQPSDADLARWGLLVVEPSGNEWLMESVAFDDRAEADEYAAYWNIVFRPEDGHSEFRVVPR